MQQHGRKYFARAPLLLPRTLEVGSIGQNSTFSKPGHVVSQVIDRQTDR